MPPKKRPDAFLLIVESPSKCAKIESYLGESYRCISSKGHIREIDGLSKINIQDRFQIEYNVIADKRAHVDAMKKTVAAYKPNCIYLATDDDREGESIAWHICEVCGLDPRATKRIVFHEITQPAVLNAVAHPRLINLSLVAAQQARQVLDMVVGYKISPLLWRRYGGGKNALSAGRCQTPALRLVLDHDKHYKEALARGAGQVHKIQGIFTNRMLPFQLTTTFKVADESDVLQEFIEKTKTHPHLLSVGPKRESTRSPPKPFNTSRLLQVASNQFRFSPKTTMMLCQTLYQSGLITYMRTDCQKYSDVFMDKIGAFIESEYGVAYLGQKTDVVLTDATMPHEAIRVTNIALRQFTNPDAMLTRLYGLIWRNTVESCMSPAKYRVCDVAISAPLGRSYKHTVEVPLFLGWRKLELKDSTDEQATDSALLLYLEQIDRPVSWTLVESKIALEERSSPHFTEASLIQKLEDLGIGRPSTFSSIVETIQERGYVKKTNVPGTKIQCVEWKLRPEGALEKSTTERTFGEEKDKLVIQPTGILVAEFLLAHFDDCFSYNYTKHLEDELDAIASLPQDQALNTWHEICRRCADEIKERSKPLAKQAKQSFPLADTSEYVLIFNGYGASLKRQQEDGSTEYCKVATDIDLDLEKAKRGEYTFSELAWREDNGLLGTHDSSPVYLKRGKYGLYAEWRETTYSLKSLSEPIVLRDVVAIIKKKTNTLDKDVAAAMFLPTEVALKTVAPKTDAPKSVVRGLRKDLSIRKGKFGNYVFHQTDDMTTPKFYPLNPIKENWQQMDDLELIAWIENTYRISI
jgi:DNA topoisomerase-1